MTPFAAQRSRSDRAFERLYRRHVDDVYRYAFAVLANRADAEDVTQTAFLNAYRAFQSGRPPERPLNWLITIAHNVCRQRFRERNRRPREVVLDTEVAAWGGDEEEAGFRREDIVRALSQLNFNQRAALVMRELEGRSYGEIAEILDVSVAAVETLIFRARRAFREQLEGSLTCSEAERALSRDLDGMLARAERGQLRAHLRSCDECATIARRFRAQRSALRGIVDPLPTSLAGFSATGGSGLVGGTVFGTGVGLKVAALGAAGLVVVGVSSGTGSQPRHTEKNSAAPRIVRAPAQVFRAPTAVAPTTVAPRIRVVGGERPAPATASRRARTNRPERRTVEHTAVGPQALASGDAATASDGGSTGASEPAVSAAAKPKPTAHRGRPAGKRATPGKHSQSSTAGGRGPDRGSHGAGAADTGGDKPNGNGGNDGNGGGQGSPPGQAKPEKDTGGPSPPTQGTSGSSNGGEPADPAKNGPDTGPAGGASSESKHDSKKSQP